MVRFLGSLLTRRHAGPGTGPRRAIDWAGRGVGIVAAAAMALTLFPSLASADVGGTGGAAAHRSAVAPAGKAADAVAAPAGERTAPRAARAGVGAGTMARAAAAKAAARLAAGGVSQDVAAPRSVRGLMAAGTPATGGTALPQIPVIGNVYGITMDSNGTLYVLTANPGGMGVMRVLVYTQVATATGRRFVLDPGATITGLNNASGLAVDDSGTVYVAETGLTSGTVSVWDQSGETGDYTYTKDSTATTSLSNLGVITAVDVDQDGTLYVSRVNRVTVYVATGDLGTETFDPKGSIAGLTGSA
ncbi:MAG: hypothetical protein LBM66_07360, partial [Bifidobacteriaceae bacterium]|nr:hypothetical protein [Bifidobacteriaceae bacterium]